MKKASRTVVNSMSAAVLCAAALSGCATYGTAVEPYQFGNYYDQYSPAYDYYPGQAAYPYAQGYYDYPYPPGYYGPYYGPRVIFGPSIYFGAGRGSSGVGVGTTLGF